MNNYTFDINNKLIKENYLKTHLRLAILLRSDIEEDNEELLFLLLEDWYYKNNIIRDHDSKGNGYMNK